MSWTSALLPFVDFSDSSLALKGLEHVYGLGIGHDWDNITAVHNVSLPTGLTWSQVQTADFWQHYVQEPRYSAAHDPLRISNVKEDVLSSLARKLADVPIRHVVLVFLESTRKDIFPIKKDGLIWRKLSESYENKSLPSDVEERLASLTPNANYLTGDYDDGFPHAGEGERRRGGINFNNAYTSATYTLKSLVGTLCGSSPLVADFNLEVKHRLPTPCLPHVFDAMNHVQPSRRDGDGEAVHEFLADKWQSFFMQSATMDFDSQESLLRQLGYPAQNLISKEYLQGKQGSVPKHGVVNLPDVNYFSLPETPLEEYFRDVFVSAKEKRERVFLTHLSSTTHHPFGVPEDEKYVPMTAQGFDNLSKYINAIGFDDKWLGKILAVLNEQGVAEETLVVMVGDHGASMPENGMDSAYYNPNVGNFHVPLVLSHPKLPVINIDDAVTSIQVLPTVLDLLVETGSLAPEHAQLAKSLAAQNYGGQSMIRNLLKSSKAGQGDWQFTVVNPGRAMVSVRDARRAHFRLIVPVIKNGGWRFTDLELDPTEETPVQNFEFEAFLDMVKSAHGIEVAMWAEEAASIARWWVEENCKRWDYRPDEDS